MSIFRYKNYKKQYRNKYLNKSCRCHSGHQHDSRFEAGYCDELALQVKVGHIKSYEIQKQYSLDINGSHICNHIVDFVVTNKLGLIEIHETKGFATRDWRIKWKLFEALYPDIPYRIIK